MSENREALSDREARRAIPHAAAMAALDELDYRKQNGRFPVEQVKDALLAALPHLTAAGAWTSAQGEHYRREMHRHAEDAGRLRAENGELKALDRDVRLPAIDDLRAENERLRKVLDRIARQGMGRWSGEHMATIGHTGEKWIHWATLAENALATDETEAHRAD